MELHTLIISVLVASFGLSFSDAADADSNWGYPDDVDGGEIPPAEWATIEGSFCGGRSQSPIDLDSSIAVEQEFNPWILEGYTNTRPDGPRVTSIYNGGHGFTVNLAGDYLVQGGGLPTTYKGLQFHIHWGENFLHGAEHFKDGAQPPAELHIVHYDIQFDDFVPPAISAPQGLAVLGFFIEAGDHNPAWDPIIASLNEVLYVGDTYTYQEPIQLSSLFPYDDLSRFYRYNGSLTTPGCQESVVWTVFEATIKLSLQQMAAFRVITEKSDAGDDDGDDNVANNHRPVQPLNDRTLYAGYAETIRVDGPAPGGSVGSCAGRCGEYTEEGQCQCNSVCSVNGNCCSDYREQCLVEVCSYVPTFGKKQRKQRRPGSPDLPHHG